jgi:hypothetical protein
MCRPIPELRNPLTPVVLSRSFSVDLDKQVAEVRSGAERLKGQLDFGDLVSR